jgi:hypothetical protein
MLYVVRGKPSVCKKNGRLGETKRIAVGRGRRHAERMKTLLSKGDLVPERLEEKTLQVKKQLV